MVVWTSGTKHDGRGSVREQTVDPSRYDERHGPQQRHAIPPFFKPYNLQRPSITLRRCSLVDTFPLLLITIIAAAISRPCRDGRAVVHVQGTTDGEPTEIHLIKLKHLHHALCSRCGSHAPSSSASIAGQQHVDGNGLRCRGRDRAAGLQCSETFRNLINTVAPCDRIFKPGFEQAQASICEPQ